MSKEFPFLGFWSIDFGPPSVTSLIESFVCASKYYSSSRSIIPSRRDCKAFFYKKTNGTDLRMGATTATAFLLFVEELTMVHSHGLLPVRAMDSVQEARLAESS